MVTSIVNLALPEGDPNRKIHIHGYQAESYSETMSAPNFEMIDISGRSSPIAYYTGGGSRTVTFSMLFHRDMVEPWSAAIRYAGHPAGIEVGNRIDGINTTTGLNLTDAFLNPDANNSLSHEDLNRLVAQYIENWNKYYADVKHYNFYNIYDKDGNKRDMMVNSITYDEGFVGSGSELTEAGNMWWRLANEQAEADATARFHLFLNKIKALNYPVYTSSGVVPPKVYLKIGGDTERIYMHDADGNLFFNRTDTVDGEKLTTTTDGSIIGGIRLKGYCNANINYDGIVKHNSLISCSVDFTFTEVVDQAWSAPEIIGGMKRYVQWMDQTTR